MNTSQSGAQLGTAGTAIASPKMRLLRFGSFWAQNVSNIALINYKYILVWCTAWNGRYGLYGHREPKSEIPQI